ncbi:MAG TPA: hypothetical protein DCQ06_11650 [Myxococcales bacterium]|nr:hypothetical protein [Myxococcales bacterium]
MMEYFSGMVVGFIVLKTSLIAPTLFKMLGVEQFGVVIRALWPKFFVALTILGVVSMTSLVVESSDSVVHYTIAGITIAFPAICYALIPMTNRATDTGDKSRFDLLHKSSVALTVVTLFTNIAVAFV